MSNKAIRRLECHPLFVKAQSVLLFHSLPDEVDTHTLIDCYARSKQIILPSVCGDDLQLHVYHPDLPTAKGPFGIVESQGTLVTDYTHIDLAIIPGVAFDRQGNRLGRGRGYYDRLLPHLSCPLIGLCHPFQIVTAIPTEPHDKQVDEIISG